MNTGYSSAQSSDNGGNFSKEFFPFNQSPELGQHPLLNSQSFCDMRHRSNSNEAPSLRPRRQSSEGQRDIYSHRPQRNYISSESSRRRRSTSSRRHIEWDDKLNAIESKFDQNKRRREDNFFDFVRDEGKKFLLKLNQITEASPRANAAHNKSSSSDRSEQQTRKWIIDRGRRGRSETEWEQSMTKADVFGANSCFFSTSETMYPCIVSS